MIKPEDVTIIIPHLGEHHEQCYSLQECLTSLRETFIGKIIVVKNGSNEFCTCDKDIRINTQGQCKAVNAAVATTNTPWVFITNDDMVYPQGWWDELTSFINPKILCVSPILIEPRPGAPTFEVFFAGGAGGDFDKKKFLDYADRYKKAQYKTMRDFRRGFNFPVLIKRELWDTIGGYDINYDPWGSNGDSDLEYKIKLAGVQPYQNPRCPVYHFSQTSGTFNPANDAARFRNYAYFKEKWGFDRTDNGIWEATFEIPSRKEGRIFKPDWEGKYANH